MAHTVHISSEVLFVTQEILNIESLKFILFAQGVMMFLMYE